MQVVRNTNHALKTKSNGRLDCLLQLPFQIFIIHSPNQIITKDFTSTKRKQMHGSEGILNLLRSSLTCKSNALEFTQLSQVIGRCCQVTPKNSRRCERVPLHSSSSTTTIIQSAPGFQGVAPQGKGH